MQDWWSPHTIVALAFFKRRNAQALIITHYSQPGHQPILDQELTLIIQYLQKAYPHKPIILTSDLNRSYDKAALLASNLNLTIAQTGTIITRQQNRLNQNNLSQLDYIFTNLSWSLTFAN